MIRSSVRSAGLALLLTVSGCGTMVSSGTGTRTPGLNVAEAALQGGAGQIALQVSDGVLRDSPNNVRAMEIKGDALTLLGDYDQAEGIFQALLAKDPNSVRAGIGLGRVRLAKDPAAAEVLFQKVLQHDPKNVTALNNLGIARDLQGRHAQAQPAYREALAINPDLESAQVNLALSMAISGQGPAAIKLLQARATQPGAPTRVKHDYAVVLAMAGNRAGAERVLSDDMPPDEARQLLDSATGTRTRAIASNDAPSAGQRDDEVPPDVVQVPEGAPARLATDKPAQPMAAALAAPPPMVVRPRASAEPTSDVPAVQPVNPVAAAVTNQQPLALPMHATPANPAPVTKAAANSADADAVRPEVVAMPPADPVQRPQPDHSAAASSGQPPLPDTSPPVLHSAALLPATTRVAAPVAPPATAGRGRPDNVTSNAVRPLAEHTTVTVVHRPALGQPAQKTSTTVLASAAIAPALMSPRPPTRSELHSAAARPVNTATETVRNRNDSSAPTVQFAAAPTQEAAHSFWQVLVHRYPDVLGKREPVVIRFEHDGAVFWRVRAEGFASLSEAQSLCERMRAGGQACFVPRS